MREKEQITHRLQRYFISFQANLLHRTLISQTKNIENPIFFSFDYSQCVPDLRSSIDEALLRAITVNSTQNEAANNCSFLDLTVKHDDQNGVTTSKGNSVITPTSLADVVAMDGNVQRPQYNTPVCLVSHMSSSINQDLAEADQSMENDATNNENAVNSPEILNAPERGDLIPDNGNANEGAVGGIESSPLPDLAKVTTTTNCEVDFVDTDL